LCHRGVEEHHFDATEELALDEKSEKKHRAPH
jgi:hypothetical protein